jgi:hypothetical protein
MRAFQTLFAAGLLVASTAGCSTTANKENMLSAAGFKTVPANTPQRQAQLNSLPTDEVTPVQRNGITYYTFPDPKRNVLYVGQEPQYQEYQRLRLQNEMAQDELSAPELNQDPFWGGGWDLWGGDGGLAWR